MPPDISLHVVIYVFTLFVICIWTLLKIGGNM